MKKKPASFAELLNPPPYRWPKTGDHLLKPNPRWDGGAGFSDHPFARDAHIWSGYMTAGHVLVEWCKDDNNVDRFDLVYPILFNFRHGLEVAMKWVLDRYGRYVEINTYERDHNLNELWKSCRHVIEEVGGPGDVEATNAVEQIVKEFHALDPLSFSFRYSMTKGRKVVKLPDFAIDLQHLSDVMEGVNNFFTGVDGQLDHNSSAVD